MENEEVLKAFWQKPEMTDLDVELTSKIPAAKENSTSSGPGS
jgi:hypothetical protein